MLGLNPFITSHTSIRIDFLSNSIKSAAIFQNGKVDGAESTPFVLPQRWTYNTLLACVKDYSTRSLGEEVEVLQLYCKKAKAKTVVKINSDTDIPALLNEYPLCYKSGKNRSEVVMYVAVDFRKAGKFFSLI